jgi:mannose-1-phosphate guanylyltransferase
MKALILVGGFGTRLRPLTLAMPKPLVPFVNKPMIIHQVEALKAVGVTEVILAVAYRPDAMKAEMDEWAAKLGVTFHYSHETSPLGTAGPLALAKELITANSAADEPFFVLNSDVTCEFPMADLLAYHKAHGKEGTIMVTKVQDPTKYGVVVYQADGKIDKFVEKPKEFVGDQINAGIYIFNKAILERIPLKWTSIETQIFPAMAASDNLYAMELKGFWMDIGQPIDYIDGLTKYLPSMPADKLVSAAAAAEKKFTVVGSVVIDPSATIAEGAKLGPNVTIGPNVTVGPNARISTSAIFSGTKIGTGAFVNMSIIGWNNTVGDWARIDNYTVTGDDVQIHPELYVNGAKVLPNKGIKANVPEPIVIM